MKKPEYNEGPKAKERFENAMAALFKAKKSRLAKKIKKRPEKGKD